MEDLIFKKIKLRSILISFHFLQVLFFKCGHGRKDDKSRTYPLHLWAVTPHHPTPVFFRRIQNLGPFDLCATLDQGRQIFSTFTFQVLTHSL